MPDLLPCPFCGGEPELDAGVGEYWVRCIMANCGATGKMSGKSEVAVEAWNRRVDGQVPKL